MTIAVDWGLKNQTKELYVMSYLLPTEQKMVCVSCEDSDQTGPTIS